MNPAMWVAKTGLDAQQTRISVIANNLANVNTTGFKASRSVFQDLMYQTVRQAGAQSTQNSQLPSGLMLGTGVQLVSTEKLFNQGNVVQTNNPLDIAIEGRGFFPIQLPDGTTGYSRDGSFHMDSQGQLVTSSGYPLSPNITVPAGAQSLTIGNDGTVSVNLQGQNAPTQIGSIQLFDFVNPAGLQPVGQNLFMETAASGTAQTGTPGLSGFGRVSQAAVESSNVNAVEELVSMIETQRAYEMNSKAIEATNQMLQYVNNHL